MAVSMFLLHFQILLIFTPPLGWLVAQSVPLSAKKPLVRRGIFQSSFIDAVSNNHGKSHFAGERRLRPSFIPSFVGSYSIFGEQRVGKFSQTRSRFQRPSVSHKKREHELYMTTSSASLTKGKIHIVIEYCSACQWMLRSTWMAAELLTTFSKESTLASVALVPQNPPWSPGGIFRVLSRLERSNGTYESTILWDRGVHGRFPESKEMKQLIRDLVNPNKDLGHSDRISHPSVKVAVEGNKNKDTTQVAVVDCLECNDRQEKEGIVQKGTLLRQQLPSQSYLSFSADPTSLNNNTISIKYSTGPSISSSANRLYQATWYTNELLSMVYERNSWWKRHQNSSIDGMAEEELLDTRSGPWAVDCVTLIPIQEEMAMMHIEMNGILIFNQSTSVNSFLDANHLCSIVSKMIHSNEDMRSSVSISKGEATTMLTSNSTIFPISQAIHAEELKIEDDKDMIIELMSDEDANAARKFFGVF